MDNIITLASGGSTPSKEKITISVEGQEYKVQLATTEEEREQGLQGVSELPKGEGMLFVFEQPSDVAFWMKNTEIPLQIIYIDKDDEVVAVHHGSPYSNELLEGQEVLYVLEIGEGDGDISVGDDVDLSELETAEEDLHKDLDDDDEEGESEEHKLLVLGPDGETQMELEGGERIFSRPNTKTLVKLAKRAYKSKKDSDYKRLGNKVFQYLETQDNKEEDFVDIPETD